jgi:uncharacterized DUF497 family protein
LKNRHALDRLEVCWDDDDNAVNRREYGVEFADAQSALKDPRGLVLDFRSILSGSGRFKFIGRIHVNQLLIIVRGTKIKNRKFRIEAARPATDLEESEYDKSGSGVSPR